MAAEDGPGRGERRGGRQLRGGPARPASLPGAPWRRPRDRRSRIAGSIEKSRTAAASAPEQRSRHQPAARRAVRAPERRAVASGLRGGAGGPRAARRAGGAGRGSRGAHGPGA